MRHGPSAQAGRLLPGLQGRCGVLTLLGQFRQGRPGAALRWRSGDSGTSQLVELQNVPFKTNDPWLPPGATDATGNNAVAYADIAAPDGSPFAGCPRSALKRAIAYAAGAVTLDGLDAREFFVKPQFGGVEVLCGGGGGYAGGGFVERSKQSVIRAQRKAAI